MKINNSTYEPSFFFEKESANTSKNGFLTKRNSKGICLPMLYTKFNGKKKKKDKVISKLFSNKEIQTIKPEIRKSHNLENNFIFSESPIPKINKTRTNKEPNYVIIYKNCKKFKQESNRALFSDSKTIGFFQPKKKESKKKLNKKEIASPIINSTIKYKEKLDQMSEIADQLKRKQYLLFMKFCKGKGNEVLSNSLCSNMAQSMLHEQLEKLKSENLKMDTTSNTDGILNEVIQKLKLKNFDHIQSKSPSTFNPQFIESNSSTNFIAYNYYRKLRSFRPLISKATLFNKLE